MIFALFVLPIAAYCFVLGIINRRRHPVLVPGVWDFLGLLFAASGFLALGGPAILTGASERWRLFWLAGRARGEFGEGSELGWLWALLPAAYFLAVVAGVVLLLRRRRQHSAVYNVEAPVFEEVFAAVLDDLGLAWSRSGDDYFLGPADDGPLALGDAGPPGPVAVKRRPGVRAATTTVMVDLAPLLRHATLRWDGRDPALRGRVEKALVDILGQVRTRSNPIGGWLLLASAFLMGFALMAVSALVVVRTLGR